MADEPRRSGRAGKGHHTKLAEEDSHATPPPTKQKSSKGKSKKKAEPEAEEEDQEDVIRCICDKPDTDQGVMVACDRCGVWQHTKCVGLPHGQDQMDAWGAYLCEQCDPAYHEELLSKLEDGEKPWKGAGWWREDCQDYAPPNKRTKKDRKSLPTKQQTPVKQETSANEKVSTREERASASSNAKLSTKEKPKTPTPAPPSVAPGAQEKNKRKPSSDSDGLDQPSKLRKPSAQDKASADIPSSTRKSSASAPHKKASKQAVPADDVAGDILDLKPQQREASAKHFKEKFQKQIKSLTSANLFRIPDIHTESSLAEFTALAVEHAMFKAYCDVPKPDFKGPYQAQLLAIASNVTRNEELLLRLLNEEISAEELAKMSSDDMASEEQQKEAARIKEQADKQSTLVQETTGRPNVRRTHKGEEYIEDPNAVTASESLPPPPTVPRHDSEFLPPLSPTTQDTVMTEDGAPVSATLDRRQSSNFNIDDVWSSVQPSGRPQSAYTTTTQQNNTTAKTRQEDDPVIDRLLDDEEDDTAPYSPNEYEGPPVAWTGHVDMPNIGKFKALAQHVAGADLSQRMSVEDIFPESLTMSGRIHGQKADDYLSTLGSARSTDVVVFNIIPSDMNEASGARKHFLKLWKYFVDRDRWGVVSDQMHREHVTDTYIVPLATGMGEMPGFLSRLHYNVIEQPRPREMLLAVFVIKWRNQQNVQNPTINTQGNVPAMTGNTPVGPGANLMSPIATPASAQQAHAFPPPPQQTNNLPHHAQPFPDNPYGTSAPPQQNGQSMAQAILGQFYTCSTAQHILSAQEVPEPLMKNLRHIFEQYPQAQTDLNELTRILSAQGAE